MRWSKRRGLLGQKVVLIHASACPHRALLIQTLKDFHWKQFKHLLYSSDLAPSNYHLFPQLKRELGKQCYQTREEPIYVRRAVLSNTRRIDFRCQRIFSQNWVKIFLVKTEQLVTWCNKCLNRHVDYVEKYFVP